MEPTPTNAWYAVYTKPGQEKKVAYLLTRKGYEIYCPQTRVRRQCPDQQKGTEEPLFTSFVFIRTTPSGLAKSCKTKGVVNIMYWLDQPVTIHDAVMEAVQHFLLRHPEIIPEKCPIRIQQAIELDNGSLLNTGGDVMEIQPQTRKLFLPMLGYVLIAGVEKPDREIKDAPGTPLNRTGKIPDTGVTPSY